MEVPLQAAYSLSGRALHTNAGRGDLRLLVVLAEAGPVLVGVHGRDAHDGLVGRGVHESAVAAVAGRRDDEHVIGLVESVVEVIGSLGVGATPKGHGDDIRAVVYARLHRRHDASTTAAA